MLRANPTSTDLRRRQLLRGEIGGGTIVLRPPWARPEPDFIELCTRCDSCISACEEEILFRGSGGYPEISFKEAGCTFCGDCLKACEQKQALSAPYPAPSLAWDWKARIQSGCLSIQGIVCRACGDACETHAIAFKLQTGGRAEPILDHERCNGCGECLAVCPNDSIILNVPETVPS